jgi:hypothetical protein
MKLKAYVTFTFTMQPLLLVVVHAEQLLEQLAEPPVPSEHSHPHIGDYPLSSKSLGSRRMYFTR